MATYMTLIRFTERGTKQIKDTCKRAADFKTNVKKLGIEVKEQYWCMGAWDGVIIFDAPNDEIATAGMISLSSQEFLTTQTMRTFTVAEMGKVLGTVSQVS